MTERAIGGWVGWLVSLMQRGRNGLAVRRAVKTMQVVETLSFGGRRQVTLMRCGDQHFLVGMSGDGVSTIVPLQGESK